MGAGRLRRRAVAAAPALGAGLAVLVFYLVEASLQKTPWVFTDELEWTQISRAIAATGHAARRGQPVFFKSLYAYLIAPAWWIRSTADAYAAIKVLNAVVMCLAALPTYLLARMLCARRSAVAVAALSLAIPAMSYATSIIPEPLAYSWFALAAWLAVRALAAPRPASVALALAAAAVGPLVRKEFVALPAALALAAAVLWVAAGARRAALRERVPRVAGALAALGLFAFAFNQLVVERIQSWTPGQYLNGHTLGAGALAFGALAIGLGIAPFVGGLAALNLPERRGEPAYRAFSAYLAAAVVTLGVYTAAKVTYIAGGGTLIEERNLFFLSPLLLLGAALALGARRLDWRLVAAATVLALACVWSSRFETVGAPYFEAPGLAILTLVNREFIFYVSDCRTMLALAAAVTLVLLALRRRPHVPLVAALLVGAWLLTGEIYATITNEQEANVFANTLPSPRSWVDTATHGAGVTFLGQSILDPNELWLTEFWNRSLQHVASLDGGAPGPGPALAPALASPDGTLGGYTGDPFTLAGPGVVLDAPLVAQRDGLSLYATPHGWRLLTSEEGVYSDGWQLGQADYTYFDPGGPGVLELELSRAAYNGPGPAGRVRIVVGTVGLDTHREPVIRRVLAVRLAVVPNGEARSVRVAVPSTPVTVVVSVATSTLIHDPPDPRLLGVKVVAFSFSRGLPVRAHLAGRRRTGVVSSHP